MIKDEALKMAIEVIEGNANSLNKDCVIWKLKKALEQPTQEPVTCLDKMQSITEQEYYEGS